jgi:hypothetical protein
VLEELLKDESGVKEELLQEIVLVGPTIMLLNDLQAVLKPDLRLPIALRPPILAFSSPQMEPAGLEANRFFRRYLHEWEACALYKGGYMAPPDFRCPGTWRLSAGGIPIPLVPHARQ